MDPQQQQAVNALAGISFGLVAFIILLGLAVFAFFIYLFWRILKKAGLSPGLAFLAIPIIPFGPLILMCIIAFSEWKVVPATSGYLGGGGYPPNPLPPGYPPQSLTPTAYPQNPYPPAGPPTQL